MNNCPYEQAIGRLFRSNSRLGNDFHKTVGILCQALRLGYKRLTYGIVCDHVNHNRILAPEKGFETAKDLESAWNDVDPKTHHVNQRMLYRNSGTIVIAETLYGNPTSLHFDWAKGSIIVASDTLGLEDCCDVIDINNPEKAIERIARETYSFKEGNKDPVQNLMNYLVGVIDLESRMGDALLTDGITYRLHLQHLHDAIHIAAEEITNSS